MKDSLIEKIKHADSFTDDEKKALIQRLEVASKSGLIYEAKEEAIEKKLASKKTDLKEIKKRKVGTTGIAHRLIEGDNLHGLTCLKNKNESFDIIYIDPPYNTGNKDFKYNDHYVDLDDDYRHSKWISFMAKRLEIAHQLLKNDGAIFISIDDAEHARLKLLCDEIFGSQNFVANLVRKNKSGSGHDSKQIAVEYDYVLCYAKQIENLTFSKEDAGAENDPKYKHKDEHIKHRGKFYLRDLDYKGSYSPSLDYAVTAPDGTEMWSGGALGKPNTWRWGKEKFQWGIENDYIVFKQQKDKWKVYIKQYQFVDNKNKKRQRLIPHRALIEFSNSTGSSELKNILNQDIFSYPKPTALIEFVLDLFAHKKSLHLLDFFAGSGTSLHATMLKNKADGGQRQCTLITNNENKICEEVTYQRGKKVIEGYKNKNGKSIKGLENNILQYYIASFKA